MAMCLVKHTNIDNRIQVASSTHVKKTKQNKHNNNNKIYKRNIIYCKFKNSPLLSSLTLFLVLFYLAIFLLLLL